MRMFLCAALAWVPAAAFAQIEIESAWVRATAPGARVAGGYVTLRNKSGSADRLVGVTSPAAERVEMHVHLREGEVMKMRPVSGFDVPAGGMFELKPGGAHLMFMQVTRPFKEGEKVLVKLRFEKAGELSVEFSVGRLGAREPPANQGR